MSQNNYEYINNNINNNERNNYINLNLNQNNQKTYEIESDKYLNNITNSFNSFQTTTINNYIDENNNNFNNNINNINFSNYNKKNNFLTLSKPELNDNLTKSYTHDPTFKKFMDETNKIQYEKNINKSNNKMNLPYNLFESNTNKLLNEEEKKGFNLDELNNNNIYDQNLINFYNKGKNNNNNNNNNSNKIITYDMYKSNKNLNKNNNNNDDDDDFLNNIELLDFDKIKNLPIQEQLKLLYENNKDLYNTLKRLQNKYNLLKNKDNSLFEKNSNFKNFILKENEDLKRINKNYEKLIEPLVDYVNEINNYFNKEEIDTSKLKNLAKNFDEKNVNNNTNELQNMCDYINSCKNDVLKILENPKKFLNKKKVDFLKNNDNNIERKNKFLNNNKTTYNNNLDINNINDYYDYYSNRNIICPACLLGICNSNRGYSPLLCGPHSKKYIHLFNGKIKRENSI